MLLCNDVLYSDEDDDMVQVEWLEYNDKGHLEQMDIETYEISIGAVICAVTVDVIQFSSSTWQVPKALHASIEMKLEKQPTFQYSANKQPMDEQNW